MNKKFYPIYNNAMNLRRELSAYIEEYENKVYDGEGDDVHLDECISAFNFLIKSIQCMNTAYGTEPHK